MNKQPSIETQRLILRPLESSDAERIQRLAGDCRVSAMTENIPYPYENGMAEAWIETLQPSWETQERATFAVCLKSPTELIGCCGLKVVQKHKRASLGYWLGTDYWSKGYCTEAAKAVTEFGFNQLKLHRIEVQHLTINPASGAVMRKIGMKHEATMSDYVFKKDGFQDMELYSSLT